MSTAGEAVLLRAADRAFEELRPNWESAWLEPLTEAGGWTRVFRIGPGYVSGMQLPGRFEMHSVLEEIILLEGKIDFDGYYTVQAPAVIIHPPYWVHPSSQLYDPDGTSLMLIKLSAPVDFVDEAIPDGWNGVEYFSTEPACRYDGPRGEGITGLELAKAAWVEGPGGLATAVQWENPAANRLTSIVRVPAGWSGPLALGRMEAHEGDLDELYLMQGQLAGEGISLEAGDYFRGPTPFARGARSDGGALAVRWTPLRA